MEKFASLLDVFNSVYKWKKRDKEEGMQRC